ncbi:hypothetical protein C8Q75DRAFT_846922 [Abortiporus biennis]|nr:hypothetical protein C8Q75DRAFT_846922 [Abortiporus biennis]
MSPGSGIPLRGRKRFQADLNAVKISVNNGFEVDGIYLITIEEGEDEGAVVCEIADATGHLVTLTVTVSDTSEYPKDHSFFAYAQDEDPPADIEHVTETIADSLPCSIEEIMRKMLDTIAKKIAARKAKSRQIIVEQESDEEMYEDEDEDYEAYEPEDFGLSSVEKNELEIQYLQRDFNEIVAAEYRPGLIRLGGDEVVLSVSIPVVALARDIAPRALQAWDSRFLSRSQYLTLLISGVRSSYPVINSDGTLKGATRLQFRLGLTKDYKPSKEYVLDLIRNFGLKEQQAEQTPNPVFTRPAYTDYDEDEDDMEEVWQEEVEPEPEFIDDDHPSRFKFSLSSSLESLMQDRFLGALQLRLKYGFGWAGAEYLLSESERLQRRPEDIINDLLRNIQQADEDELVIARNQFVPPDPLAHREQKDHLNLPLLAFSYMLRRLSLCYRFCLICYNRLSADFEVLKPYVCSNKLCSYQYYNFNRGTSLEYEICSRPTTVDLLVSLAYCAAADGALDDPLPIGLGLMVPAPYAATPAIGGPLVEFDSLDKPSMCKSITEMLNTLPAITDMKKHLEKKTKFGTAKPKLADLDPKILPAAWLLLRWCVASCTAHLEELTDENDRVRNIDRQWRQFRFSVGAPDAEAKFAAAQMQAQTENSNARKYPHLYAFHGSATKNWHSIIRHGLWYKTVAHGRAYGDGVYFAKDGSVSMSGYAHASASRWRGTQLHAGACVALAQIVNLPAKFRSKNPYFVVPQTEWILCRYLLVNCVSEDYDNTAQPTAEDVPYVTLDPAHPLTLNTKSIKIPEPSYKLTKLLEARQQEYIEENFDEDDRKVFEGNDWRLTSEAQSSNQSQPQPDQPFIEKDPWIHNPAWVEECVSHILPPPVDHMPMATNALQRELKAMLKEQESARSLKELGWYMPPEFIGDNLFQWIVELHSFEDQLPIAKDLKKQKCNSLVFEIRFPPNFPHSPPFFRILKPRFLPFIQGGGGHVTGGGSMCMDLLTSDGWLPSYSIPAILLQIRLAISNLEPRPARLAINWQIPYSMMEAIEGYKRAANTHGWRIPPELDRLARGM